MFLCKSFRQVTNYSEERFRQITNYSEEHFHQITNYSEEHFHQITNYSEEQFRQITNYSEEQFCQITNNSKERFRQITNYSEERFCRITTSNILNIIIHNFCTEWSLIFAPPHHPCPHTSIVNVATFGPHHSTWSSLCNLKCNHDKQRVVKSNDYHFSIPRESLSITKICSCSFITC